MAESDVPDIFRMVVESKLDGVWSWSVFRRNVDVSKERMVRHSDKTYSTWFEAHTDGLRECVKCGMTFMHTTFWREKSVGSG